MLTIESWQVGATRPYRVEMYRHCQADEPALNCPRHMGTESMTAFKAMERLRLKEWTDKYPGSIYSRVFKITEG